VTQKGKAAKMKAEPKQRRLTRDQRRWLKLQEFIPQEYQEAALAMLPFLVHAQHLGMQVVCVPVEDGFEAYFNDYEKDVNAEAKIKLVSSMIQAGYPVYSRL
jgi:hypothetical protein